MDMYAHPSFIRGEKEAVAQLRKGRGSSTKTKRRDSPSPPFSNGRGISPLPSVHSIHPTVYSRKISICETDGNLLSKPFTSSSISLSVPLEEHTSCSSSSSSDDETEQVGMFCFYIIYVMVVQVVLYFLPCIKIL